MTNLPGAEDWRLAIHATLPSTSDIVRQAAMAGEPDGLAVLALHQTSGRGSRGRGWESPPGNLFLSALLRPAEPARDAGQWSLLAGVALWDALAPMLPEPRALRLKWPNDVLLDGRKLAGILVDSAAGGQGGLDWIVVGMGVNLAVAPDVPGRVTACLAEYASPPEPPVFARDALAWLGHWRRVKAERGFAAIRAAWLARAPAEGSHVVFRAGEHTIDGAFVGLGEDGSLLLRAGGRIRTFGAGEVLA